MAMSQDTAERWVIVSAVATAGIYFYRSFTEGSAPPATLKRTLGAGKPPVPLGAFATAWGFTYFVVAIMAQAAPAFGGSFAILIMAGDLLTNGSSIFSDVLNLEKGAVTSSSAGAPGLPSASATLAATDPLQPYIPSDPNLGGFATQPPSVTNAGVNPRVPVYVPPPRLHA